MTTAVVVAVAVVVVDREGFEPSISPMPRAYPTSLDDRPTWRIAPPYSPPAPIYV